MAQKLLFFSIVLMVLIVFTLVSCTNQPKTVPVSNSRVLLGTPEATSDPALLVIQLTQEQGDRDAQAAATAQMARAEAQAALNAANATLGVALTQDQDEANRRANELTATALIADSNALATLDAAAATQYAAQTQDAIAQTQTAVSSAADAQVLLNQQTQDALAAATQTAVAERIATQTQSAAATSQWYADQKRQRNEQLQGPITYFWMCCLPIFFLLLVGLALWSFLRWLRIKQDNQRILESPIEVFQAPPPQRTFAQPPTEPSYLDGSIVDHHPRPTLPGNQVEQWMDEVKTELENNDEKDKDDNANG